MKSTCSLLIIVASIVLACSPLHSQEKIHVFLFTDININSGEPDNRQSLVHLLWYTDELEIMGIVPERWDSRREACELLLDGYEQDYETYHFDKKGYPNPAEIIRIVAHNPDEAE